MQRERAAARCRPAAPARASATATPSWPQIEGLTVDDDPAQGMIDGRSFTHPDLRLQFVVPTGYLMQNGTSAVTIEGSRGQGAIRRRRFNGDAAKLYLAACCQD